MAFAVTLPLAVPPSVPVDHRAGSSPNSSFVAVVRVVKHGHLEVICSGNTQHMPVQRATLGDSGVLFHAVRLGARSDYREVMLPMVLPCRKPPAAAEAMTRTVPDEGRSWWVSLTAWRSSRSGSPAAEAVARRTSLRVAAG